MKRSAVLAIALLGALGGSPVEGQPAGKTYRIGILVGGTVASIQPDLVAFRSALAGFGYQEGKSLEIDARGAGGYGERLPSVAAEILRAMPDVVVAVGTRQVAALQRATTSVPIVMLETSDPIGAGFIASLARPGGNVTGQTEMFPELAGKQIQLLKELVPGLRRLAVIRNPSNVGNLAIWRAAQDVARRFGIQAFAVDIRSPDQIDSAIATIPQLRVGAILVASDTVTLGNAPQIARLIAAQKLPAIYENERFAAPGGLLTYASSEIADWRAAATYVDRILKGASPAVLPVERPTVFVLTVNLKTAREIGITVPQSILLRADQIIR